MDSLLMVDFETYLQIGSFEYLPKKFLGFNTKDFGSAKDNPFLSLKDKIINDSTIVFEDKCQAIRFMSHIPFKDATEHLFEICKTILENENYSIDKRFTFFSTNKKYFKLDDHLVYKIYPYFLELCLERKYPYYFIFSCSKYLLQNYDKSNNSYCLAKNFLFSIIKDSDEQINSKINAIDILLKFGEFRDKDFAIEMINNLGFTDFENLNKNYDDSTYNILRTIFKKYLQLNIKIDNDIVYKEIEKKLLDCKIKYEGKTLFEIFNMIYCILKSSQNETTFINRLLENLEINNSDDYLTVILNLCKEYIKEEDYYLDVPVKDEIRNKIFGILNQELLRQPSTLQEEIMLALVSDSIENKNIILEYIEMFEPRDEVWDDFRNKISLEDFEIIYKETINEWVGTN
jgi:hypothetical protein